MKKQSRTVSFLKRFFDVRRWSDWDRMRGFTTYLLNGFKKLFVPRSSQNSESFEEVQSRMNLTDEELMKRQNALWRLSVIMLVIAFFLFGYALFLLWHSHLASFFLCFVVTLLAVVLAFRYHYWHFLIKKRTLQSSISDWFKQGILREKS